MSHGPNDASFLPSRHQLGVQVTLTCGHTISMRLAPINKGARYGCSMGQGCGYSLRWVKYTENSQTTGNTALPQQKTDDPAT